MRTPRGSRGRPLKGALRKELGRSVVEIRERRGWNQGELARRLGVPRGRLGKWERGLNEPSLEDLSALSETLEVPLEELGVGRRPDSPEEPISPAELMELVRLVGAMGRLLKPWIQRRG
jgi:transcriptional regulator with XRE-family HTH domain